MCDPWKLAASAGVIAGSAYHFLHKYMNVGRQVEGEDVIVEEKVICTKELCPCVEEDCRKPKQEKVVVKETDEALRVRCDEYKEELKRKRVEDRERLNHTLNEEKGNAKKGKAKKMGNEPAENEEEPKPLGHDQKGDKKVEDTSKAAAKGKKVDESGKQEKKEDIKAKSAGKKGKKNSDFDEASTETITPVTDKKGREK